MVTFGELYRLTVATYTRRAEVGSWERTREFGSLGSSGRSSLWLERDTGEGVLAFPGTASLADVGQDVALLFGVEPRAWRRGREAVRAASALVGETRPLVLTGHSIGGAFASTLGAELELPTATFNAPGMLDALRARTTASWIAPGRPHVVEFGIRADWIRQLSGPTLGRRYLLGPGSKHVPGRPCGPRGMLSAFLAGLTSRGPRFVRDSLALHAITAFEPYVAAIAGTAPFETRIDDSTRSDSVRSA